MVFHDEDLDRLTDQTGPVAARTAADLRQIRLKDSTDRIPTLAEVLALIAGRVPLLIELKDQTLVMGPTDGRLEAATAAALQGYRGEVALMSFNPSCIHHLARLAPDLPAASPPPPMTRKAGSPCRPRSAPVSAPSPTTTPPCPASSAMRPPTLPPPAWPS
ncbi:hypothetical protein MASR1M32_11080 [Rhodobacter sp.]